MVFPNALLLEKKTSVRVIFVEKAQKAMIEKKNALLSSFTKPVCYTYSLTEKFLLR